MNILNILKFINEEINNWFNDEPSIADKYYEKKLGITTQKPENVSGDVFGYLDKQWTNKLTNPVAVYKNPKNLNGFDNNCRGVLVSNGDIYVAEKANGFHYNLLELLATKNIIPKSSVVVNYGQTLPEEYITINRYGKNGFSQSEAYEEFPYYYTEMFDLANNAQPFMFTVIDID